MLTAMSKKYFKTKTQSKKQLKDWDTILRILKKDFIMSLKWRMSKRFDKVWDLKLSSIVSWGSDFT